MDPTTPDIGLGVPTPELSDDALVRELSSVHTRRTDTLRFGSSDSLVNNNRRMAELEAEYLRRHPEREVDPGRLREGARTGANEVGREENLDGVAEGAW
ncbi:DUF6158 family protein [Rhizomonospora bruguierae]|uniref:DUF6158 family protein n=1 Tax=Rhizomonospora bruguierae TaxID=1581705 RepID=UPI001BCBF24C|nr:DUF6158 family protein [Micromonospora sp. NBRC 107566]